MFKNSLNTVTTPPPPLNFYAIQSENRGPTLYAKISGNPTGNCFKYPANPVSSQIVKITTQCIPNYNIDLKYSLTVKYVTVPFSSSG